MAFSRSSERWKESFRLAKRVARIEKRIKQKNALLPPQKQKDHKKDSRYIDAVKAYFVATKNALRGV